DRIGRSLQHSQGQSDDRPACLGMKRLAEKLGIDLDGRRAPSYGLHEGVQLQPHMFPLESSRERREHRAVAAGRPELGRIEHAAGAPLFSNRERARASGICCVKSFYGSACELARIFGKAIALSRCKEALECDIGVLLADKALQAFLNLREQSLGALLQLALAQHVAWSGDRERGLADLLQQLESLGYLTVNELRPEFHRRR